jgi:hypothetical protein
MKPKPMKPKTQTPLDPTSSTVKLIRSLAESRSKEAVAKQQEEQRLRNEKSTRWEGVLNALADYERAYPNSVIVEFPENDIEKGDIVVHLCRPRRRLVFSEARFIHIVGIGIGHYPAVSERKNGWPIDAAETPGGLVVTVLEILADHLNSRKEKEPFELAA